MIERSLITSCMDLAGIGSITCKMHKKVVDVKKNLDELFHEIDAQESRELKQIKKSIGEIAIRYRLLEDKATSLVEQTLNTAADVKEAANRAIRKDISVLHALKSMDIDFQSLQNEMENVRENHIVLKENLIEQADRAKCAKETNDQRAAKAEQLREDAQLTAIFSIPGAALLAAPVALAVTFAEDSDEDDVTVTKVCKGVGGFLLGVGAGIGITAISPLLLAYSASCGVRLAALSRQWSAKFQDIEGNIREVAGLFETLTDSLRTIQNGIKNLAKDITKGTPKSGDEDINCILKDVADKSEKLQASCETYQNYVQSNKIQMKKLVGKKDKI